MPVSLPWYIRLDVMRMLEETMCRMTCLNICWLFFGCGSGDIMQSMCPYFQTTHGIELISTMTKVCKRRFIDVPNVHIHSINMLGYTYCDITRPIVLYMFEPLWTLSKKKRGTKHLQTSVTQGARGPCILYYIYITGYKNQYVSRPSIIFRSFSLRSSD